MNKKLLFIIAVTLFTIGLIVSLIALRGNSQEQEFTGGSGQPDVGALILTGYETPTNNGSKLPVGRFLNTDQQTTIRTSLETILFKTDAKREYQGTIVPGTVTVDFLASDVTFDVKIEDPASTYKVTYNTITNKISIFDSRGESLIDE